MKEKKDILDKTSKETHIVVPFNTSIHITPQSITDEHTQPFNNYLQHNTSHYLQ